MEAHALLEGLTDEQRVAVTTSAAPLCILAGAGTGKTRVLTRRIAHRAVTGSLDPRRVLVLTFTRAAAGELVRRLGRLGLRDRPVAGTFHAIAYAQMRRRYAERRAAPPTLLERKVAFVARQLPKGAGARAVDVTAEIEWAKARVIGPAAYAAEAEQAGRDPKPSIDVVADVYGRYEAAKRKAALVDFDDLLWLAIHALEHEPETAAALRWQHRHVFVDEFQDVNPLQFRLLRAWLGSGTDLCAVGDPNQAIYAWNGADPDLIARFPDHFPGATVVALTNNHRSSPQVLALANRILDAGALPGVRLVPTRAEGPDPVVVSAASAEDETGAIVAALRAEHDRNTPWSHHAVLVRTNALAALVADALRAAGIPVRVRAQTPFVELPAVKSALALLKRRGLVEGLAHLDADASRAAGDGDDLDASAELPDDGTDDAGADDDRMALTELVRLMHEYLEDDPAPSPAGFTGWLATATDDSVSAGADAVVVATFHAAKGLEWPVVHLAGLEDGLVPHSRARTPAALDEERRLFYVAVTRAERLLRLSWAQTRPFGEREARRRPSPLFAELSPVLAAMAASSAPADSGRSAAGIRDEIRAARHTPTARAPGALEDALADWRERRARASGMPAAHVLDDDAIAAICAHRPDDERALAAIVGHVRAPRLAPELLPIIAGAEQVPSGGPGG